MTNNLLAADTLTTLATRSYDPRVWPEVLLTQKDYIDMFAAVNANCAIDKLINTITEDIAEGASKFGARIAGASMYEFTALQKEYKKAGNEFGKGIVFGKAIQIIFNYSI